jgi:uncharacterized membrane protein SpoIIM required for sporulation
VKLAAFEASGRERWTRLSLLLDQLESRRGAEPADVSELPALYRHVCNDLALARDRQLSTALVSELNELALRGHRLLYQARTREWTGVGRFLLGTFPRAVRREWRLLLVTHVLFYGLALGFGALSYQSSDLIYSFIDPSHVQQIEHMYDPDGGPASKARDADDDARMFGYYIWNNVSIAFRTFASGLAFGVGAVVSLVFNALFFGLIAAHLVRAGSAQPFFSFVIAHGAFELTAILLSGAAGMRLGLALLAPGARTRIAALRDAAQLSLPIITGAALMLVIAAGFEAFWSPRVLPLQVKYAVGASLWGVVALWLGTAGGRVGD